MNKTLERVKVDPRHLNRLQVEMVVELAWKSFAAVPEDKADWKPAPTAKSAHDILRHAVEVNHRFAGHCAGRDLTDTDLKRIEKSTATYAGALDALRASGAALSRALTEVDPRQVEAAANDQRLDGALRTMTVGLVHLTYHWGQVCSLQTLWGDGEDHFLK